MKISYSEYGTRGYHRVIKFTDLRTGNKIINYNLSTEESFDVTTRLAKALGGLVTK